MEKTRSLDSVRRDQASFPRLDEHVKDALITFFLIHVYLVTFLLAVDSDNGLKKLFIQSLIC